MKILCQHLSDADHPAELREGLSPTVFRAAGVASALRIRSQLSKMTDARRQGSGKHFDYAVVPDHAVPILHGPRRAMIFATPNPSPASK